MTRTPAHLTLAALVALALPSTTRGQATPARAGETGPAATLSFPAKDVALQRQLDSILSVAPFRRLLQRRQLSVALVDLSDSSALRFAGVEDDRMRYAASLPKIAIMLTVFDGIEQGRFTYTPALRAELELMIRRSDNHASTRLIEMVGFEHIAAVLQDPRYQLYDPRRNGGLWVGRDYGGGPGLWRRDPMHQISHGATARQVARFLVMMQQGRLISPTASAEMKRIMGNPAIHHKFVLGLDARPRSRIFRKSGTWRDWHADAALVQRDGHTYVAVALMESSAKGIMSRLIVQLDNIVFAGPRIRQAEEPAPNP